MEVHWQLKSDLRAINQEYEPQFEKMLQRIDHGWFEDKIGYLTLGYREALVNAYLHGNKESPDLFIDVDIKIDDQRIVVSVSDKNPEPFDSTKAYNSVDDPENLMTSHGRGIFLMRQAYPGGVKFEFMNPGNKVTMIRNSE